MPVCDASEDIPHEYLSVTCGMQVKIETAIYCLYLKPFLIIMTFAGKGFLFLPNKLLSFIHSVVFREVHRLFQSEFSTECDLVLPF